MKKRVWKAIPTDRLWGTVRVWAWLFMASAGLLAALLIWHGAILANTPSMPMTELDVLPGQEWAFLVRTLVELVYLGLFLVGGLLVLMWYLRSVRNAHALSHGIRTSPGWAIWLFILPLVSLWKPYGMTSELWRSSQDPERWKSLPEPGQLRVWWGLVLVGAIASAMGDLGARNAHSSGDLMIAAYVSALSCLAYIGAGVLFLRIGSPISRQQTALISAGQLKVGADRPDWAA